MKAATLIKRIESKRKDIAKYQKQSRYYEKEYCSEGNKAWAVEEGRRWIAYYAKLIDNTQEAIVKLSREAAKLATEEEHKEMIKAMADDMAKNGFSWYGHTTNGLHYTIEGNCGLTERSRHCYSMIIEGKQTVFTSGTLETVAEYILKN